MKRQHFPIRERDCFRPEADSPNGCQTRICQSPKAPRFYGEAIVSPRDKYAHESTTAKEPQSAPPDQVNSC